jgi:hypothetical protein
LDENTTFLIGILKIVSGYNNQISPIKRPVSNTVSNKKETGLSKVEIKKEPKAELDISDIDDIF